MSVLLFFLPVAGIVLGAFAIFFASEHRKAVGSSGKAMSGKVCGIIGIALSAVTLAAAFSFNTSTFQHLAENASFDVGSLSVDIERYNLLGDSESKEIASTAEERELEQMAVSQLGRLTVQDSESVAALAAMVDEDFRDDSGGYALAALGIDATDMAAWLLTDFSYEVDSIFVSGDEGSVYADVKMRDSFAMLMEFNDANHKLAVSDELPSMTDDEILARQGELLRQAMDETTEMTDYFVCIDFEKTADGWVMDQGAWENELEIMFML